MCENEQWKAEFLHKAFKPPIIFNDMKVLGTGFGTDAITEKVVRVPKVSLGQQKCLICLGQFESSG